MATILVADDNSNIQKMVSLAFQEKGIRVVAVGNGEAACRKVPEVRPDVVLADVFMPVRNGYEVCEFVKQDPEFAETPVILLVGAFDPLDEKEAARVGANGVLKKPFVPPEPLISMVNSLLGRTQPEEETHPTEAAPKADHSNIEYATKIPFVAPARNSASAAPAEYESSSFSENSADAARTASPAAPATAAGGTEEDDLGPENEWAQRRKTIDYEIDAADSASLVEKLAGESAGTEASGEDGNEILASDKHMPFGGANIPEIPQPNKWAAFFKDKSETSEPPQNQEKSDPEMSVPPVPAEETPSYTYDASPPEIETADSAPKIAGAQAPSELLGAGQDVIPFRPPQRIQEEESAQQPHDDAPARESDELVPPPKLVTWPLQEENSTRTGHWLDGLSGTPSSNSQASEEEPKISEAAAASSETPPHSETIDGGSLEDLSTGESYQPLPESSPSETEKLDSSTVDDVVAKVISKLEPQLHQALANGVLRPLVEELLNEKKKK